MGAKLGYPGLVLDPSGHEVEVQVFESADPPDHWLRLDAFEGAGYRRVLTPVRSEDRELKVSIYVTDV